MDVQRKLFVGMAILAFLSAGPTRALTPQAQLQQYLTQLQTTPDDQDLRLKIIQLAKKVKPPTPDAYAIQKGSAVQFFKQAQSPADYHKAVDAFRQASLLAPWKADLYYNLGLAQEKAGLSDDAVKSYQLYLLANPKAKDKEVVLGRIGAVQAEAKAALDQQAAAAKLAQRRWVLKQNYGYPTADTVVGQLTTICRIQGTSLFVGTELDLYPGLQLPTYIVAGSGTYKENAPIDGDGHTWHGDRFDYTLSSDGNTITETCNAGCAKENVYTLGAIIQQYQLSP